MAAVVTKTTGAMVKLGAHVLSASYNTLASEKLRHTRSQQRGIPSGWIDHQDNHVRELLCFTCNNGLGSFKDDPVRLRAAAEYIERDRKPTSGY